MSSEPWWLRDGFGIFLCSTFVVLWAGAMLWRACNPGEVGMKHAKPPECVVYVCGPAECSK